ncbi:MAG: polysulfide reductase NrfD [Coriobacteriaceae bacterium]|jgi:polysulfide reductase chain C|nr:polysulfide reductase NrfD [Coriobacteriaceae bacterium]
MNKHYWTWPIAIYLFLGGLGGGILSFALVFDILVPGSGEIFAMPVFIALVCLGLGCFFLVFELGQPTVFLRVFLTATAIIKWGAILLSVALIFGFVYWVSCLPWDFVAFLIPLRGICLALAGICGALVMVYTGVLLASLKAHAFWSTPALPVLFTVSALSTGSALCALALGMWPFDPATFNNAAGLIVSLHEKELIYEALHLIDMVLIGVELLVLLMYVLLLRGSGNAVARAVATRWVSGKVAPAFWGGMVIAGLLLPLALYSGGGEAAAAVAPVLVLAGGCLLRFLVVFADDRRKVPGEDRFYRRLPHHDAEFLTAWKNKEHLY